jgi:signal transduction histidine kinase
LVEDFQQLIKADAARAHLRREKLSLPDLVDQVVGLNRHEFATRGITVATSFHDPASPIDADWDKLIQVLSNLIQNAWQYTPAGGRLRISSEPVADGVRVSFVNTGANLDAADLPFIFERFYRGEKSRSRESGGAGIGLTIVKQLIEAHGGSVGAALDGDETSFWFMLPA